MRFNPNEIQEAIVSSIKEANREYSRLTGNVEWITDRGVESFLAYFVGRKLKKLVGDSRGNVFIEVSMKELKEHLKGRKIIGRPGKHFFAGNRVDVVMTDKNFHVVGVVELKRNDFISGWKRDIERVAAVVRRAGVKFGCFAVFLSEDEGSPCIQQSLDLVNGHARKVCKSSLVRIKLKRFKPFYSKSKRFDGVAWRYAISLTMFTK